MNNNEKMAFLILAHNDPKHLKKLIYTLDYPMFDIYVHVDAKVDISQFGFDDYHLEYSNLYVLDNRVKVYWADYSVVQATIILYEAAMEHCEYVRYITLSGNDYPLKSNDTIYRELRDDNIEFIMGTPSEKQEKVKYYFFKKIGVLGKALTHLFRWMHIVRNKDSLVIDGEPYVIFFAPQWHALSGSCINYILNKIKMNNEELFRYFRYSFAPDELLIPTLLFNNEYYRKKAIRSKFPKGTHYNEMPAIHYINYEPIVQVLTEKDSEKVLHSEKLFARKLRSGFSDGLINYIDAERNK